MKTPPKGIKVADLVPGHGLVILPISNAPQLWSWFSMKAQADALFTEVKKQFPDFQGELYDMDAGSAMFIYMLGAKGPRTWSIHGALTNPDTKAKTFVDIFVGETLDTKPAGSTGKLFVHREADAGPEIADHWPFAAGVTAEGELAWRP